MYKSTNVSRAREGSGGGGSAREILPQTGARYTPIMVCPRGCHSSSGSCRHGGAAA